MPNNILSKITLGKWIALAVVLAAIAFVLLIQFTSFQIPKSVTEGRSKPQDPAGIQSQGSTETRTNLDEVNDIIRGKKGNARSEGVGNDN
ncbi:MULTISPECIES: hypothetical protein [Rhodobacterales]|nr:MULTISPECIES: hypothetical protein [Rhodobacterales]MCQ0090352.1 hypothetical protein [Roseovarius sp. M141]